jgi:hypothetical protein
LNKKIHLKYANKEQLSFCLTKKKIKFHKSNDTEDNGTIRGGQRQDITM